MSGWDERGNGWVRARVCMGMYVHQPIGGARNCDEYDTGALHTREHKSQNASAIVKRISRRCQND